MKELKTTCYKGTRILIGNRKRQLLNAYIDILIDNGFTEIQIPIIQYKQTFVKKVGEENNNMMYTFKDRKKRELCLAPEYTAVIQQLAKKDYKYEKDICIFYINECFRGEKPQKGRYRQFTQLGLEIINSSNPNKNLEQLKDIAIQLIKLTTSNFKLNNDVTRGLDYYKDGKGFEIECPDLGSSKQVCGGGIYDGGVGFAIGVDRVLLLENTNQ